MESVVGEVSGGVESVVGKRVESVVGEVSGGVDQVRDVTVHHRSLNLQHCRSFRSYRSRSLLVSQTSGLNILELQKESVLSHGNILSVGQVGSGDLRSLDVIVDGGEHSMITSLRSVEGLHEGGLCFLDLDSIFEWQSGHSREAEDKFVHV